MPDVDWALLFATAREAAGRAHAPYSTYTVGAALLCADGTIVPGCNVENATYGLTVCAERTAVVSMVASGHRDPVALAVVTPGPPVGTPCGMCRQTLAEFTADMPIRVAPLRVPAGEEAEAALVTTLAELLPNAFRPDVLAKGLSGGG